MGLSENSVPHFPNGFADHYPYFLWLFHWGYTIFLGYHGIKKRDQTQGPLPPVIFEAMNLLQRDLF